jgi:hypothetical protein
MATLMGWKGNNLRQMNGRNGGRRPRLERTAVGLALAHLVGGAAYCMPEAGAAEGHGAIHHPRGRAMNRPASPAAKAKASCGANKYPET